MTNQNQSVIDNDHQRVWNGSFTGMWNAARPARASNRGCFFVAVLCGPELESKKCVESAVLKLDDAAVHVATEHHSADDSHRARIILGNGTNDTHSVALLESLHQPLLHAFWFAEKYCGSAATLAGG